MSLVPSVHPRKTTKVRASATMTHSAFTFPAPNNGVDVSQPLPGGDPTKANRLSNLIPRVFGCVLRAGYADWASNMGGKINTLMSYQPAHNADGKQFAASETGDVYDVTTRTGPLITPPVAWSFTPGDMPHPGEFSYVNFTTTGDVHFLCVVGEGMGYKTFDGTAWVSHAQGTAAGEIEGIDPKKFDYVCIWKSRLWFIEANSTVAWYLPVGVIAGKATAFDFGSLLPNGGSLAMISNWTVDGGEGLDDNLVILSNQGDTLLYKGSDPDNVATFSMVGRWYIGRVPAGRRCLAHYSTDVAILSEKGLVFLSEILRGQAFFDNAVLARNINGELSKQVIDSINERYWEVRFLPREQVVCVNAPSSAFGDFQWVFEVNSKAFCTLSGIPALTIDTFDSRTFFGDDIGKVWAAFTGDTDGALDGAPGRDIEGYVVTTFQTVGDPVRVKRFLMIRPSFVAPTAPAYSAKINPNWVLSLPQQTVPFIDNGTNKWDLGVWDVAVWSGEAQSFEGWVGATGTGRFASLAMRVKGLPGTTFIAWTVVVDSGGIL
jgi:hypothetical protein